MKKILVPTNFSDLGDFAYTVANHLANETNSTIDVLSIVPGPQGAIYSSGGDLINDEGNDYSEWYDRLENDKKKMVEWTAGKDHIVKTDSIIGNIDNDIIAYAESNDIDLIVMGTEGLFDKKLWSKPSHTQYITNHTSIPVLSLKCDRSDIDLKEMVFVGDFLHPEKINLDCVKTIQKAFNSKLVLLKIKTPSANRTQEEIVADMHAFAKANELENYETNIYSDQNVEAGIGKFSAERDIDMIILGTHQHKGFSRLFRKSISDDVVNHLYHPVLTFPLHS